MNKKNKREPLYNWNKNAVLMIRVLGQERLIWFSNLEVWYCGDGTRLLMKKDLGLDKNNSSTDRTWTWFAFDLFWALTMWNACVIFKHYTWDKHFKIVTGVESVGKPTFHLLRKKMTRISKRVLRLNWENMVRKML